MISLLWLPLSEPLSTAAAALHTASFFIGQGHVISVNTIVVDLCSGIRGPGLRLGRALDIAEQDPRHQMNIH